jgi:hypothetical protein
MLLNCTNYCRVNIILSLLMQQLVSDEISIWKTSILRQGFKVSSMCVWHLYVKQHTPSNTEDGNYNVCRNFRPLSAFDAAETRNVVF